MPPANRRTVRDAVEMASLVMESKTRKGWTTYMRYIVEGIPSDAKEPRDEDEKWLAKPLGDLYIDEVLTGQLKGMAKVVGAQAARRALNRDGAGAQEGFIACARYVWREAVENHLCSENIATPIKKPVRRLARERRALSNDEIQKVYSALMAGPDSDLGAVVLRLGLETGARSGEMLSLTYGSLQKEAQGIRISRGAKMGSSRTQPVTLELYEGLTQFALARNGGDAPSPDRPLLINKRGAPVSHRWMEESARRVRDQYPEFGASGSLWFTWHLLRHTGATLVERASSYAMAEFFLGHAKSHARVGLQYMNPTYEELAQVMDSIWGPLNAKL